MGFTPRTETLLTRADDICSHRGARLTELRRQVLGLILDAEQPTGAYELLDRLKTTRNGAAPPTIYRALDFLLEHGLIHRLERLSAFVGCVAHDHQRADAVHEHGAQARGGSDHGRHGRGPGKDAQHEPGPRNPGQHKQGQHKRGQHEPEPREGAPHEHGPLDPGPHVHGPHVHGPHAHGPHEHGPHEHGAQFLICHTCGRATEIDDHGLAHALQEAARRRGFTVGKATIEAEGQCAACASSPNGAE